MSQTTTPEAVLNHGFRGETIHPNGPQYDAARAIYNGSIDRRPAVILRPRGSADVIDAVNYARDADLRLSVRCGGHGVAGTSVADDGVLIDLSALKGTHVDPARRTAMVGGGALWGEVDRDTQLSGLATPGGRVTTTGVGGFTLGGGYAWLSSKHGLACDNLIGADVVTADGRLVHVSDTEHPELMWGLRGAGANFGVVTSYEFRLHPVGPTILAGMLVLPNTGDGEAAGVARWWRDQVEPRPESIMTGMATLLAPPEPFVPPDLVGRPVFGILVGYPGPIEEGERELAALRREVAAAGGMDLVQPMPYTAFQSLVDPFSPKGLLNYHRGVHVGALTDEVIDAYLEVGRSIGSPLTQGIIFFNGGAISQVPEDATAASHRAAPYMVHPIACWDTPDKTAHERDWVQRFTLAFDSVRSGGIYLNFEPGTSEQSVRAGYTQEKYDRLVSLKDEWDPGNLFRSNHNIPPTGWRPPPVRVPEQTRH